MGRGTRVAILSFGALAFSAFLSARRRARLASGTRGFVEDIMPSVGEATPSAPQGEPVANEAHAPGHRRRGLPEPEVPPAPRRLGWRPFAKHRRGLRHPGRG